MNTKIENYIKTLKVDEICRTCLSECHEMISLFAEVESTDKDISFVYQILMNISSAEIFINDGLPTLICKNCVESANNAFKFKVLCERSAVLLNMYFTNVSNKINIPEQVTQPGSSEVIENDKLGSSDLNIVNNIPLECPKVRQNYNTELKFAPDNAIIKSNKSLTNISQKIAKEQGNLNDLLLNTTENYEIFDINESTNLPIPEIRINSDVQIYSNDNNKSEITNSKEIYRTKSKEFSDALIIAANEENIRLRERIKLKRMHSSNTSSPPNIKKHNKIYKYIMDANGSKFYCCSMCDKRYKHSASLTVHIRNHTMENPYLCMHCGKGFKHFTGYRYHMQGHNNELPYKCNLCDKKYRQSSSLTVHMRSHTGQRPFLCSICGKGFRQQPDLGYHMRTHTKEKPYMCSVCGKTMSMQCHLVQHMRTHTGEKPFKCNTCNKAFPSSTRLKRHEIIHTGLKPYVCQVCDKAFNRESTLIVHAMIHTDVRPHICHHCGRGFIQLHCLRNHIKTHIIQKDIDIICQNKLELC